MSKRKKVHKKQKKKNTIVEESKQEVAALDAHREDTQLEHKVVYEVCQLTSHCIHNLMWFILIL